MLYVVVPGSDYVSGKALSITCQIGCASLCRLLEGVRPVEVLPGSKSVISGGIAYEARSNADV